MMTLWAMGSSAARSDNAAVVVEPHWVVDASIPGPDMPPSGASLFDRITTLPDGRRDVPFPFDKLLQRFEAAAGCSAIAFCARSVLLPLGRSLQRVAASPDYFRFPRVVSGIVGTGNGPWLLRDRLYVGYQERAGTLEVISYNDAAGRFEFQQVKNYRAGAQPQVFQARRTLCIACHQNHGPIFPRQVWDETNANAAIAARLAAERAEYFGVSTRGSTDVANALDDATDRSNRIALVQRLWWDGCGEGAEGERCRASAFAAALQLSLTAGRAYEPGDPAFSADVVRRLQDNAGRNWPGGLAVPNPDLPNRDPLTLLNSGIGLAAAHVPARLEPLLPRPALEVLAADGARLANILVTGVADALPAFEVERLSKALRSRTSARSSTYRGRCTLASGRLACVGDAELKGSFDGSFITVDALRIGGGSAIRNLYLPARRSSTQSLSVALGTRDQAVRLPDGNAVTAISVDSASVLTVRIVDDFRSARPLIAEAVARAPSDSHSQRLERVTAALDGRTPAPRHTDLTVSVVETEPAHEDAVSLTAPYESRCGSCHHTPDSTPPNFLSGDVRRVKQALQSCAPRIFVRLAMADVAPDVRQKTPMPPETARGHAQQPFAADIRVLRTRVESMLKEEYGRVPPLDELLRRGYESLRPCLPAGL